MAMLYVISMVDSLKDQMWLVYVAQFIKSTGVIVATGYMWALVPEVISFGEYTHGRRISGIVNALTGIFYKAGMALGGVVPGLVLAFVGFDNQASEQTALAQQGILWLVAVIPAILLALAIFIISRYELTDDVIDKINMEIDTVIMINNFMIMRTTYLIPAVIALALSSCQAKKRPQWRR